MLLPETARVSPGLHGCSGTRNRSSALRGEEKEVSVHETRLAGAVLRDTLRVASHQRLVVALGRHALLEPLCGVARLRPVSAALSWTKASASMPPSARRMRFVQHGLANTADYVKATRGMRAVHAAIWFYIG